MINPFHHAVSSAKKYGGKPEDYQKLHDFFDQSKSHYADFRHRALRHHSEGIFLCEQIFGPTLTNSDGRIIPTRWIGEQHVMEDCGFIPTVQDWLKHIQPEPWMRRVAKRHTDPEQPEIEGAEVVAIGEPHNLSPVIDEGSDRG